MVHEFVPAMEREDVVTITNNATGGDGTNETKIINDATIEFEIGEGSAKLDMSLGMRDFVS